MEPVLLDTDVISYLFKRDTRSMGYEALIDGRIPFLSFMTVAELRLWNRARDWGQVRRRALEAYLTRYSIVPCDDAVCTAWAEVVDGARRQGRPIQTSDAWIAAAAIAYGLPLVTHDPSDYAGVPSLRLLTSP